MSEEIPEVPAELPKIADDAAIDAPAPAKVPANLAPYAGAGRERGKPNRLTRDMRRAAQFIIDKRRDRFITWIDRVGRKDPAYACELYIRLLGTFTPRPTAGSFEAQVASYPNTTPGQPSVLAMRVRQVLEAPVP